MIIIGEKINGAIPSVATYIKERNAEAIAELARAQTDAGANYIDVCAGTSAEDEYDALCWLLDVVQNTVDTPICLDSPDPQMLLRVLPLVKKPGIINSVSLEKGKCEQLLPFLRDNPQWQAVFLCCSQQGNARTVEEKMAVAEEMLQRAEAEGISANRIHIDPLVLALSAVNDAACVFVETVRKLREKYPTVHITAAVSNISFGMPARRLVNAGFLAMSMEAGLDSAIMDPTNKEMKGTILANEALLAKDRLCRKYYAAYRKGELPVPVKK